MCIRDSKLIYSHLGSPQSKKRFFKMSLNVESPSQIDFYYTPDFSYGDAEQPAAISQNSEIESSGGLWNFSEWYSFFWSNPAVARIDEYFDGNGFNVSMAFHTNTKNIRPYTIQSLTYHFTPRGWER